MCCKTTRMFHIHINKKYRCHLTRQTGLNWNVKYLTDPSHEHITPLPLPQYWNKKGTHSVSKAFCTLANEKHECYCTFPFSRTLRSIFEPRVSRDGGFAAVSIVIEQLLTLVDVPGGNEDEVRDAVDVVEFGLAVSIFTVIDQPTHSTGLFCGVHTVETKNTTFTSNFILESQLPFQPNWFRSVLQDMFI